MRESSQAKLRLSCPQPTKDHMKYIDCIDPACPGTPVDRPHLSTWASDVYFCPTCKRTFSIPTWWGKVRDLAPTVLAGCAVVGLGLELQHDHLGLGGEDIGGDF